MVASLTKIAKRKGAAILVLALLFQLFPSVTVPGNDMPKAYAESGVTDSTYYTLQSYNFPDRNVRHAAGFSVRIDPNVDPVEDEQWRIVPGLTGGEGYISFESVNMPGYYITNNNFFAKLEQNDGTDRFKAAATFKQVPGLAESTAVSYQTYTDPDRYIRHSGFVLRLDPISTPVEKTDATFQENPVSTDSAAQSDAGFVHPGGLFKKSDLERMKYMVEAGIDPWMTSFRDMKADYKSSYNYTVRGNPGITYVARGGTNGNIFELDVNAAYLNALMWAITGDKRHADKAVQIFNTWSNLTNVDPAGTGALNAGLYAWKLVEAAEIIKSTYDGWAPADLQKFKDMLVYPGYSSTNVTATLDNGTFYWRIWNGDSARHGNQDMIAWRAMLSMGVFLDNRTMYERALRYFTGQPHKPGDMPYASGPSPAGKLLRETEYFNEHSLRGSQGTIPDFGYNGTLANYVWENGQNQESSRDQQHAFFGLATAAGIAEVAWNQGYDVWNMLDNRLLKGFEFMSKYNTSYVVSFPDQPTPWEPDNVIRRLDRTGRWFSKQVSPYFEANTNLSRGIFVGSRPVYEQAVAHFKVRMGQEALWTERGRDTAIAGSGYEKAGGNTLDQPGWGALTFRRPELMAGDPISGYENGLPVYSMNVLPRTIEAEHYDQFTGDGEGHTYHDLTASNSGGKYREDSVDIGADGAGGYAVTDLENGEWLSYSVYVPVTGNYRINVRYAGAEEGGTIRFAFNGSNSTSDFGLPSTGGAANWNTYTVEDNVLLTAGVQVMQVFIGGDSQAFNLDQISVSNNPPSANYTKGSYYLYQKEIERIEAETNLPGTDKTNLAAKFAEAEAVLVPLIDLSVEKVDIVQSMVTASSVSWDNKLNAAQNGWLAFDGDTATTPDTKTGDGWVRVDLGAGNEQAIGKVRFYGRTGNFDRLNGALIQGSNDGTNFITLHTVSGVSELKWYTVLINTDTAYRYLRYYTPNTGNANVGELEFYKKVNDKTLLGVKLQEASATGTEFYSQASVAALQAAMSNAQSVYDNANATQEEIDAATASLVAALKLVPQENVQLTQSMVTASSVSWDNKYNAALNGWRAFDGDTATSPDTKTGNGWVRVDLGAGNEQAIGSVKFYPRAGFAGRMNGALIQGSNDGINFDTLYTISGVSDYKWYRVSMNRDKAYRYLRYYTANGYANAAELEFYKR
ncbi:AbfB domain-containing protein [Paenibacillus harenae]|uniref:CBM6 domain-containing protein n=1 Tax=Paenibacillus harenae TaxID=306543 RepID=A0ABT9U108_PAEHA|nr:AbfB domain-containing protein [Paenibacillus harenae]MDQ0113312.1 hypothetical protein [Paenibacillus harenae]